MLPALLLLLTALALAVSDTTALIMPSFVTQRMRVSNQRLTATNQDSLEGSILPMKLVIDKGFKIGKSIKNGVFQEDVNPDDVPSAEVQTKLMEEAATNLMNIGIDERNRRRTIGTIGAGLTAILYGALIVTHVPMFTRTLALFFPVSLSYGFKKSGDEGL
jgi:hypothetical protein